MTYNITVAFGQDRDYEIVLHDADVANLGKDQARAWFSKEFEDLECTPSNPMGKILVLDMVLNVAKYGGEDRFKANGDWAKAFATAVAAVLQRPAIRVDVANFMVG